MEVENKLDKFGKFLVDNLRDRGIHYFELLLQEHWKAPSLLNLQKELAKLPDSQKEIVKKAVIETIDTAIHDFLFALQEQAYFDNEIQITVDGANLVDLSDGIHVEAYFDDGWYAKYSKYGGVD